MIPYRSPAKYIYTPLVAFIFNACADENIPTTYAPPQITLEYQAQNTNAQNIQAAWRPVSAMIKNLNDKTWYYLDEATRQLVYVNRQHKTARFSLSHLEQALNPDLMWQDGWGLDLIPISHNQALIASSNRALIWIDFLTQSAQVIGSANHAPTTSGSLVKDADFSIFNGIARHDNGLFLIFGNKIYNAEFHSLTPNALKNTTLKLVAGTNSTPLPHQENLPASQTPLLIKSYTHLTFHENRLYFWENPALRVIDVQNDKIATITGNGYAMPDHALNTFFAKALPQYPQIIASKNYLFAPYWNNRSQILKIDLKHIDFDENIATGSLSLVDFPIETASFLTAQNSQILALDTDAGSFWQLDPDFPQNSTCLLGPKTSAERFKSLQNENSPYRSKDLLGSLMLATWNNSKGTLAYAPTFQLLTYFDFTTHKPLPIWLGPIDHLATDHIRQAWFSFENTLHFIQIDEDQNLIFSSVSQFFKNPTPMGIPCKSQKFKLTEPARLQYAQNKLILHAPNNGIVAQYTPNTDAFSFIHQTGWTLLDASTGLFYNEGVMASLITQYHANGDLEAMIQEDENHRVLTISNIANHDISIAGLDIPKGKSRMIAGFGNQPLDDNSPLADIAIPQNARISLLNNHIYLSSNHGLFKIDDNGRLKQIRSQCTSANPNVPIAISGNDGNFYLQFTDDGILACSDANGFLGNIPLAQWKIILPNDALIELCPDGRFATVSQNQLCLHTLNATPQSPLCTTIPNGLSTMGLACSPSHIWISGKNGNRYAVYASQTNSLKTPQYAFGNGMGLDDNTQISKASIGTKIGKISTDNARQLYFWMRDTCSIWKIDASNPINADTNVTRLLTDDRLCHASNVAISNSQILLADNNGVELYDHHGYPIAQFSIAGEIYDTTALKNHFAILSSTGLYLLNDKNLSLLATNPLYIDGKKILWEKTVFAERLAAVHSDILSLLIPIFDNNQILRVTPNIP